MALNGASSNDKKTCQVKISNYRMILLTISEIHTPMLKHSSSSQFVMKTLASRKY